MDITYCVGQHYLTLIDCGPSRFAIWCRLQMQMSESMIEQLESVFCEHGSLEEILIMIQRLRGSSDFDPRLP